MDFSTSKEQRVNTGESAMNHAMLFTGVDIDEAGEGRRFRVENSWGEDHGDKGFFTMDTAWFDANVFEVAVHVDDLPADLRAVITEEPLHLARVGSDGRARLSVRFVGRGRGVDA